MIGFVSQNPFLFTAICNYVLVDECSRIFSEWAQLMASCFTLFSLTLRTWALEWQLVEVVSDSYHAMGHFDDSLDGMKEGSIWRHWPLRSDFDEVITFSDMTSKSWKDLGMSRRGENYLPS